MWRKIKNTPMVAGLKEGDLLTENENDLRNIYEVREVTADRIKLLHVNGKNELKILPAESLVENGWYKKDL